MFCVKGYGKNAFIFVRTNLWLYTKVNYLGLDSPTLCSSVLIFVNNYILLLFGGYIIRILVFNIEINFEKLTLQVYIILLLFSHYLFRHLELNRSISAMEKCFHSVFPPYDFKYFKITSETLHSTTNTKQQCSLLSNSWPCLCWLWKLENEIQNRACMECAILYRLPLEHHFYCIPGSPSRHGLILG